VTVPLALENAATDAEIAHTRKTVQPAQPADNLSVKNRHMDNLCPSTVPNYLVQHNTLVVHCQVESEISA
jgi:hypothetical protein